jgi:excisionase family DNA binding protein
MGMDRLAERLREGEPPLRVGELARLIGFSGEYVRKLIRSGNLPAILMGHERRIRVQEAQKLARDLRLLE